MFKANIASSTHKDLPQIYSLNIIIIPMKRNKYKIIVLIFGVKIFAVSLLSIVPIITILMTSLRI